MDTVMHKLISTLLAVISFFIFPSEGKAEGIARNFEVVGHEHAAFSNPRTGLPTVVDYYSLQSVPQAIRWAQGEPFFISIKAPRGQAFHYTPPSPEELMAWGGGSVIEIVLVGDQPAQTETPPDSGRDFTSFTYSFRSLDRALGAAYSETDQQGFLQFPSGHVALYLNMYSASRVFTEILIEGILDHTFPANLSYNNEQVYLRAQAAGFDRPLLTLVSIPEPSAYTTLFGLSLLLWVMFCRKRGISKPRTPPLTFSH